MKTSLKFLVIIVSVSFLAGCQKQKEQPILNTETFKEEDVYGEVSEKDLFTEIDLAQAHVVEEQSFEITLNDWGKVKFVSCMPTSSEKIDPLTDVSFYLLKNSNVVYRFSDIYPDNIRGSGACLEILFVMFEDSNGDGRKDVIIGTSYISGAGPQGMIPYTEVRIYEDNGQEFIYNEGLCDEINSKIPQEIIAADVKEYLGL